MNEEIWRDIKNHEGKYQVSNMGRVRSLNYKMTGRIEILRPAIHTEGYLECSLCHNGKIKKYYVHRLVAEAFLPNPDNLPQVNHKDECKTNNKVDNLEWCTHEYNSTYGTMQARAAKSKSKSVKQLTKTGELIATYPSLKQACRETGIHRSNICGCCKNKYKTAGGYRWEYLR